MTILLTLVFNRDEFCRQLRTHESLRLAKAVIPPSQIVPSSEHHYFKSHDGTRFCHFDGPRIARELILGGIPKLLLAGNLVILIYVDNFEYFSGFYLTDHNLILLRP